jgi:hypothetical protein
MYKEKLISIKYVTFNQSAVIKQLLVFNRLIWPNKKVGYDFNLLIKIIVDNYF